MTDDAAFGRRMFEELNPHRAGLPERDAAFGGELRQLAADTVFGKIWPRPGLSVRDRSLVTLGILIALRAEGELEYHFPMALRNGLTYEELEEVVYHSAIYAGFPAAHAAQLKGREVLDREPAEDPEAGR
ncbi:MAG: carboxymuconolactone decarboxylase family protein [Microbacterium sp.]